jgi:hypothetical protein
VTVNGAEGSQYSVVEGQYIEGGYAGTGDVLLQVWYHWYTAVDAIYVIGQAHVTITPPAWNDIEDVQVTLQNPQWFQRIGKNFRRGVCKLIKWLPMANTTGGSLAGSINIDDSPGVNLGGEIGGIGGEGLEVNSAGPVGHHDAEWVVDIGDTSDTAERGIWADFLALWRCRKDADLHQRMFFGMWSATLDWEVDSWGLDEHYRIHHGALWKDGQHQPGKCKSQSFDSGRQECIAGQDTPVVKTVSSAILDVPPAVEAAWSHQTASVFGIDASHPFGRAVNYAATRFAALQEQLMAIDADENSSTTMIPPLAQQGDMRRDIVDFAAAIATQVWSAAIATDIASEVLAKTADALEHAALATAQGAYALSIDRYAHATYPLLDVLYPQFNSGPLAGDCNENGILDGIEIAATDVEDANANGNPDECDDPLIMPAPSADLSSTISLDLLTSGDMPLHRQGKPAVLGIFKEDTAYPAAVFPAPSAFHISEGRDGVIETGGTLVPARPR